MSGGDCEKPPPGYSDVVKTLERQRAMTDCDDANNRNLEREVERHRRLINELAAMATNQQDDIALLRDEISLLKAQIPKPRIKVETRDEMPTIDQCSQIKAQLFHNLAKGGHGGSRRPEQGWIGESRNDLYQRRKMTFVTIVRVSLTRIPSLYMYSSGHTAPSSRVALSV
jgi:hypothetical protein